MRIVEVVREVAEARSVTPAQVALAWVLAAGNHVAPIPGTRRISRLEENAIAAEIELTAEEMAKLNGVESATGERYSAVAMSYVKA